MPKVHNKYHKTAPPDAAYVGRPSKWGNPFSHMSNTTAEFKVGSRDEAVDKYREWLMSQPALLLAVKSELAGKDLVCWCAPKRCHADILLEISNNDTSG